MNNVKAIGGYFELDPGRGMSVLPDGVLLNSGRNALRHIVKKLGIRSIHIPHYICPVVADALRAEGCEIDRYSLNVDMLPDGTFPVGDFVLYVNYFGVCGRKVDMLARLYPNLIVDCAQAYFARPKGRASFSSPRKFFGVPDGGVAYGVESGEYAADVSDGRKGHLVERLENGPTQLGYELFRKAEASLDNAEVLLMSDFTKSCLSRLDKRSAAERRRENFNFLLQHLPTTFPLALSADDIPMVYPYITDDEGLRRSLIDAKVFVATYWSGVVNCGAFAERIVPLPVDQRYNENDMGRIVDIVMRGVTRLVKPRNARKVNV